MYISWTGNIVDGTHRVVSDIHTLSRWCVRVSQKKVLIIHTQWSWRRMCLAQLEERKRWFAILRPAVFASWIGNTAEDPHIVIAQIRMPSRSCGCADWKAALTIHTEWLFKYRGSLIGMDILCEVRHRLYIHGRSMGCIRSLICFEVHTSTIAQDLTLHQSRTWYN
jgi:hypothetical protein